MLYTDEFPTYTGLGFNHAFVNHRVGQYVDQYYPRATPMASNRSRRNSKGYTTASIAG